MEVILVDTPHDAARLAAATIESHIRSKANTVLGLATGSTPLGLYRELIRLHTQEGLDFSRVTTFNLDEYLGLPENHPASYKRFMRENLFDRINIPPERINIPDGAASDIPAHCTAYELAIRESGGIDIQVLGIGADGHIGFNEPTSSLASRTRIKTLTERTRRDNARFFNSLDEVPYHCITMGLGTILESRLCILLAFGEEKAPALAAAIEGPLSAFVPASALQLHPRVHIYADRSAASRLKNVDYYHWVYEHKPAWQR